MDKKNLENLIKESGKLKKNAKSSAGIAAFSPIGSYLAFSLIGNTLSLAAGGYSQIGAEAFGVAGAASAFAIGAAIFISDYFSYKRKNKEINDYGKIN